MKFPDENWAVFNLHVNNAGKRAIKIVRKRFREDDPALCQLNHDYKNGIMAIFQREPDHATQLFASLVWVFTNKLETK